MYTLNIRTQEVSGDVTVLDIWFDGAGIAAWSLLVWRGNDLIMSLPGFDSENN
jgi:hypothetical protein